MSSRAAAKAKLAVKVNGGSKQNQMMKAYGMDGPVMQKRLSRQGSKRSVRSSHSVTTPLVHRRIEAGGQKLTQIGIMPSLKKQAQPEPEAQQAGASEVFDEEKEQQLLEEARKRKERAEQIRARNDKILNDMKAKIQMKEQAEQDKQDKLKKQLAKAREQVKANYEQIEKVEKPVEENKGNFTDKNCKQAPDNEVEKTDRKRIKRGDPEFIEPNLKAFMDRNCKNVQVFLNITDMPTWKKKNHVDEDKKVFIVSGGYGFLKKSLKKRGWVENKDVDSPCFDLKWTLRSKDINHSEITNNQLVNHFPKANAITTKVGLMHNLKNLIWFNNIDIETFYPRCYDLSLTEECDDFEQEFKAVKAECVLKRYIRQLRESAAIEDGEIKTTVKERKLKIAIKVCERRLKDLDEMIDDPKAFQDIVSAEEWKILGADELNEKKLKNKKHEDRLKSMGMELPPKPQNSRKGKRPAVKNDDPTAEGQSASDSEDIEDADGDIDNMIAKKFPEFKHAVYLIDELKKTYPQTGINGEKNIWIIKPAQSSRGRGIVLMKSLIEIMEVAKQKEF